MESKAAILINTYRLLMSQTTKTWIQAILLRKVRLIPRIASCAPLLMSTETNAQREYHPNLAVAFPTLLSKNNELFHAAGGLPWQVRPVPPLRITGKSGLT